jgi:hypothetical protein
MSPSEVCGAEVARLADTAAEAIRALNHATISGPPLPAPAVYDVLGSLRMLAHGLDQATRQLGERLAASGSAYDLYEADGRDPLESIASALADLVIGSGQARVLAAAVDAAQSAIAGQGYLT